MSAAHDLAHTPDRRQCTGCRQTKSAGNFGPASSHCYACAALVERAAFIARRNNIPSWIWKLGQAARAAIAPGSVVQAPAMLAAPPPNDDATAGRFDALFSEILAAEGFGSLHRRIEAARSRLALRHRGQIEREGWIT